MQKIDNLKGFKNPYTLDLLGQEMPVTIIPHEEIQKGFPLSIYSFKTINKLSREALKHPGRFVYDKVAVYVNSKDEKYPTKIRTMVGESERFSGVRTFGANEKNPQRGRRRSNNLFCLYDNVTGELVSIMCGDAISDFRTASSVAIGIEAIGLPDSEYSVSVLGIGAIGTAVVFALAALRKPPKTIRMVAARKCEYSSIRERVTHYLKRTFEAKLDHKVDLLPCENLKEALGRDTDIVVDAMSLPYYQEIVNESILSIKNRKHFIYADANKQALAASLVDQFHTHVFDSLKLARRLESSVGNTLKERLESSNVLSIGTLLRNEAEASPLSTCTIMGLPIIDTAIGALIYTCLRRDPCEIS
ncbi:MAG: hypothetical protein ACE5R6_08005 [Candidatus Heimdallarchaeota archaeon]